MEKPKFRIGESVIIRYDKSYLLVEITRGQFNLKHEDPQWFYWTSVSGEIEYCLGYIKEKDIIKI